MGASRGSWALEGRAGLCPERGQWQPLEASSLPGYVFLDLSPRGLTVMTDQFDQVSLESGAVTAGRRMEVVFLRSQSSCVDTFSLSQLGNPGSCLPVLHLPLSLPSAPNRGIPGGGDPGEARCSVQEAEVQRGASGSARWEAEPPAVCLICQLVVPCSLEGSQLA